MRLPVTQSSAQAAVNSCCESCVFLGACGGIRDLTQLFNCFQLNCCGGKDTCDDVCPKNLNFMSRVHEVRGLRFDNLVKINQRPMDVPLYVPHLDHRYARQFPLVWPVVAITTYELFRIVSGVYTCQVENPARLSNYFRLAPGTRVILRGTDRDKPLENSGRTGRWIMYHSS